MQLIFSPVTLYSKDSFGSTVILSDDETNIVAFCRQWLAGQQDFVLHTSGSTGTPKAIALSRYQMEASARATAEKLGLQQGTKALLCLHAGFVAGTMMIVRSLVNDWDLTVIPPNTLPFTAITTPLDFVALVPAQLQQTLENQPDKIALLNQFKAIIVGGAAVSPYLESLVQSHLTVPVYNTYGMTETVSHIALKQLNGTAKNSFFSLLPQVQIQQDERNCLQIKAPMTNHEWLTTNDIVELVYDEAQKIIGFHWIGRIDNVINSGGVKIQIEKVEATIGKLLQQFSIAQRYFVIGLPDKLWGETVHLVIESTEQAINREILAQLKTSLQANLAKYEVPKQFHFVAIFPQTATEKIDRNLLKKKLLQDLENQK
jgi:O-succinylbenzoic acid--CoA ligase